MVTVTRECWHCIPAAVSEPWVVRLAGVQVGRFADSDSAGLFASRLANGRNFSFDVATRHVGDCDASQMLAGKLELMLTGSRLYGYGWWN